MMADLRSLLHETAGPLGASPDSEFADALLDRGHRALRRRRVGWLTAGSGVVTAAVLTVMLVLPGVSGPGTGPTQLVAYTGEQPVGFVLDQVPERWHIESVDAGHLMLAPDDMKGASKDPRELDGKIDVSLILTEADATGDKVRINGRPGVIYTNTRADYEPADKPDTRTLLVQQQARRSVLAPCNAEQKEDIKTNHYELRFYACGTAIRAPFLSIQVDDAKLGWSNDQIVDFANGIHITKASTPGP
jgi:hypothetical protein